MVSFNKLSFRSIFYDISLRFGIMDFFLTYNVKKVCKVSERSFHIFTPYTISPCSIVARFLNLSFISCVRSFGINWAVTKWRQDSMHTVRSFYNDGTIFYRRIMWFDRNCAIIWQKNSYYPCCPTAIFLLLPINFHFDSFVSF